MHAMSMHVIFVAPFFMETTLRFVGGAARLPGVSLSLISQDPADRLPADLRSRLAAHWRVEDGELVNDGDGAYLTTDREFQWTHASELKSKPAGADEGDNNGEGD